MSELPHGWRWDEENGFVRMFGKKTGFLVSQTMMCELLATRGLAVIPEAELADLRKQVADAEVLYDIAEPTPEERGVLQTAARLGIQRLKWWSEASFVSDKRLRRFAKAELARRASQSGDQIAPDTAEPAEKQPDSR